MSDKYKQALLNIRKEIHNRFIIRELSKPRSIKVIENIINNVLPKTYARGESVFVLDIVRCAKQFEGIYLCLNDENTENPHTVAVWVDGIWTIDYYSDKEVHKCEQ